MNLIQKIMITSCCVAALASCKKDKPTPQSYISFKINGVYKNLKPEADYFDDQSGFLIDAGPFLKGEISIYFGNTPTETTYLFEDTTNNVVASYVDESGRYFWSQSGTLVVNAYDGKHITGTFAFKGATENGTPASTNITEGQFSADVTYLPVPPDSCATCDSTFSLSRHAKLMTRYLQHKRLAPGGAQK